jgi:hypothetical protein
MQLLGILEVSNLVKISFFDAYQNGELVEGLNKSNRTFFVNEIQYKRESFVKKARRVYKITQVTFNKYRSIVQP